MLGNLRAAAQHPRAAALPSHRPYGLFRSAYLLAASTGCVLIRATRPSDDRRAQRNSTAHTRSGFRTRTPSTTCDGLAHRYTRSSQNTARRKAASNIDSIPDPRPVYLIRSGSTPRATAHRTSRSDGGATAVSTHFPSAARARVTNLPAAASNRGDSSSRW